MVLHIANKNYSSWSLRPWVLLHELGIPFEEVVHPFGAERFVDFSPSGKVPCLVDGDLVIWDSLAIAEHLADSHPAVWPRDRPARAWARSAAAEMHSGFGALREQCSMSCGISVRLHQVTEALQADLDRLDALWQDGLDRFGGPFLAGPRFTAVDAFYAPVAFRIQTYDLSLSERSLAWAERLRALPSMRRWMADALAEPWRDPPHDESLARWGVVVGDHRSGADDDHFRKLERMYAQAPINRYFAPTLTVGHGTAQLGIDVRPDFHHAAGAMHGAVYFKALDDATFFAANSLVESAFVLTASFNLELRRPVVSGAIRATAWVTERDERRIVAVGELYDAEGRKVATGTGRFAVSRIPLTPDVHYV